MTTQLDLYKVEVGGDVKLSTAQVNALLAEFAPETDLAKIADKINTQGSRIYALKVESDTKQRKHKLIVKPKRLSRLEVIPMEQTIATKEQADFVIELPDFGADPWPSQSDVMDLATLVAAGRTWPEVVGFFKATHTIIEGQWQQSPPQ